MGYFKDQDIERIEIQTAQEQRELQQWNELQPSLPFEAAPSSTADALLDFVKAYHQRHQPAARHLKSMAGQTRRPRLRKATGQSA